MHKYFYLFFSVSSLPCCEGEQRLFIRSGAGVGVNKHLAPVTLRHSTCIWNQSVIVKRPHLGLSDGENITALHSLTSVGG